MRFMMIMHPRISDDEWSEGPSADAAAAMGKYNEELSKAGVLLALDGLTPPSEGAFVTFAGGKSTVTDGPFTEAKELVGGYWIIDVKTREEALEWASRVPGSDNEMVELRRIYEMSDFSQEVQDAIELSPLPPEQTTSS